MLLWRTGDASPAVNCIHRDAVMKDRDATTTVNCLNRDAVMEDRDATPKYTSKLYTQGNCYGGF